MKNLNIGDKCWFVESGKDYEQQVTKGVVVRFEHDVYTVRVNIDPRHTVYREVSEARVFSQYEKALATLEASNLKEIYGKVLDKEAEK